MNNNDLTTVQNPDAITSETETKSSNDKCCGIYGLRNKVNDKWYIGQSIDIHDRWYKAYKLMHCKKQRKLYNSLTKNGYDNFDKIILEICKNSNDLTDRENYWMNFYNSIENGYNLKEGGSKGKVAEETKQKISQSMKNRKLSKECIEKRQKNQKRK